MNLKFATMAVHYGFIVAGCSPSSEPLGEFLSHVEKFSLFRMVFENWSATLYTAQCRIDDGIGAI